MWPWTRKITSRKHCDGTSRWRRARTFLTLTAVGYPHCVADAPCSYKVHVKDYGRKGV